MIELDCNCECSSPAAAAQLVVNLMIQLCCRHQQLVVHVVPAGSPQAKQLLEEEQHQAEQPLAKLLQ